MLLQFNFKNFKSFRDETTLDLTATKNTELGYHIVPIGKEKVLPVAAIYGANASGKSNVIEAFRFMMMYVIESYGYGDMEEERKLNKQRIRRTPFLFDESSKDSVSSFEVYYISSEEDSFRSYNYGFALGHNGVTEEWLNVKAKTSKEFKRVFYRDRNELDLSGLPKKSRENLPDALSNEALVVSMGAKMQISKLKKVRDWFFDVDFTNFGDPIENVFLSRMIPSGFANDKNIQKNVVNYFASFDPSIIDFNVRTIKKDNDENEHIEIDSIHRIAGTSETASIPLDEESDGTLKMFALYPAIKDALENGGVLCIDELNARLHPLLVRNIIITFVNSEINKRHAQLIFTTHDSWLLSNDLLRRDEIWFTEKNENGISSLYSLSDFINDDGEKIRKDESYEKNYLLGRYGAIPRLKHFDMF